MYSLVYILSVITRPQGQKRGAKTQGGRVPSGRGGTSLVKPVPKSVRA